MRVGQKTLEIFDAAVEAGAQTKHEVERSTTYLPVFVVLLMITKKCPWLVVMVKITLEAYPQ